jgi:hypothetical protein
MAKKDEKTMSTSDFNLQKLSTHELSKHMAASIEIGSNIAVFGRRGTGKTEIAKYEIKKANLKEVYINLSVLERVDLGGYPNIMAAATHKKFVDFLLPQFYEPMIEGQIGVVALLDELDKADPSLWAPLLELIQFRSINGTNLPLLKSVVMTGNLISEGGARPSPPLLDRAEKYLVEADPQRWLDWAGKAGKIHPSITAFISDNPNQLIGAIDPEDRYADQSPRGWTGASEICWKGEERGWDSELINSKVCGRIGKDAGIKYKIYYEHYQQLLPLIDDIFNGKPITKKFDSLEPSKKLVACMISCARLANQLDQAQDKPKSIEYVGRFFNKVEPEIVLISVRSQITLDRIIKHNLDEQKEWEAILNEINNQVSRG